MMLTLQALSLEYLNTNGQAGRRGETNVHCEVETRTENFDRKPEGRDDFETLGVGENVILKRTQHF